MQPTDLFDHISIGTKDLGSSGALYDAVLTCLGIRRVYADSLAIGYGRNRPVFWVCLPLDEAHLVRMANGSHVAFAAASRSAVDAFHAAALSNGARDAGRPGVRPEYGDSYYAAFFRDIDGHKIEAVFRGAA